MALLLWLPKDVIAGHLYNLLEYKDIVRLDTAVTNKLFRPIFLSTLTGLEIELKFEVNNAIINSIVRHRLKLSTILFKDSFNEGIIEKIIGFRLKSLKIIGDYTGDQYYNFVNTKNQTVVENLDTSDCTNISSCIVELFASQALDSMNISYSSSICSFDFVYKCQNLRILNLSDCQHLTDAILIEISNHCKKLESIRVAYNEGISHHGVSAIAVQNRSLNHLSIYKCNMHNFTSEGFIDVIQKINKHVEILNFGFCPRIMTDVMMYHLGVNCKRLQKLNLADSYFLTDQGVALLASSCIHICDLDLYGCTQVTDEGIMRIAWNLGETLRVVNISLCGVTDIGVMILSEKCKKLQEINVSNCSAISDASIIELAHKCLDLHTYRMNHCNVSDACLFEISHCSEFVKLISICECDIADEGVMELSSHCEYLTDLNISCNENITDLSVSHLFQHCMPLTSLDIRHCENVSQYVIDSVPTRIACKDV